MRVRPTVRSVVLLVAALVGGTACQPALLPLGNNPIGSPASTSDLIACDRTAERVEVTADAHLDPSCTYTGRFEITASNVVLDCRGAHITDVAGDQGIGIHVVAEPDVALTNVTVRNCLVSGYLNNVRVTREGFKELERGSDYDASFSNIVIENSRLYESRGSGAFVNGYVTGVTLRNLEIRNAGGVGIYLEAGSKDNVVENNYIHHNGFGEVDPVNGVPFDLGGVEVRLLKTGREGIAVDGSRGNRISNNRISYNAAGGIFLYKNCGEYATEKPNQWWTRHYGADGNLIENNIISSEVNGIWVGSRMAENQHFMDCSDPTYASGALRSIHLDYAANNSLVGNTILNVGNAIRVEDDGTLVDDNVIANGDPAARGILIGTKLRTELLARPVDNTTVQNNHVNVGGTEAFTWIHGHTNTVSTANFTNSTPAALTPGTQPLINPWLFVVSVWVP